MQINFAALSCSNLAALSCSNLAALSCSNLAAHCLLQPFGLCVFVCKLDFSLLVAACLLQIAAACLLQTAAACLLQLTASTRLRRFDICLLMLAATDCEWLLCEPVATDRSCKVAACEQLAALIGYFVATSCCIHI